MEHVEGSGADVRPSNATTERFAAKAHETIDRVADTANQAEREARAAAQRAAERAREMQERAMQAADENIGKLRSYVEHNPLTSAGIAFAAGVVLSALLRR
jgi:ElaB/YqjD/DUF883 family membrane-anchored ribosome-binding protein